MSKFLISTTEIYRADTESEASQLIEEAKADGHCSLSKYTSVYKERKQKGEVIDAWYKVSLTKVFDDEKEPIGSARVEYHTGGSF